MRTLRIPRGVSSRQRRLRLALQDRDREIAELRHALSEAEADLRQDRARLHEIDSTVAGIASASRLIHGPSTTAAGVTDQRRDRLQEMLDAEMGRLERLLADRMPGERRTLCLDEVLGQIVALHRARGHAIAWEPSGHRILGRADDVAEAANILLENATRHGGARRVRVDVLDCGASVDISVADGGAGVPVELRERIFDWGVRHPVTGGQGIGLHIAAQLARDLGGELRLDVRNEMGQAGARFVLTLPADQQISPPEQVMAGVAHAAH